jgi:hypothetical protein
VNADDSPVTADDATERFAAAVEGRTVVDERADPELAHELAIARRLAAHGNALDPDPETRERARRRLLAALADATPENGPSRAS